MTEEILGRAALGGDLEPLVLEQAGDPLAEQDGVLGEDDPHAAHPPAGELELREPRREARNVELVDPLQVWEAGELVLAEVLELELDVDRISRRP